jgi:hypothetical protein
MSGTAQQQSLIPSITDERLYELLSQIRPIIQRRVALWYIRPVDPRKVAFIKDPDWDSEATGLLEIGRFYTFHSYQPTRPLDFHPTIAEVLAQLPEIYIGTACAFMTTRRNDSQREWSGKAHEVFLQGYHMATTRVYRQAEQR